MHSTHREEITPLSVLIGICLVLAALTLGGLYLWGAVLSGEATSEEYTAPAEQHAGSVDARVKNDMIDGALAP